jgi:hypothetical protein
MTDIENCVDCRWKVSNLEGCSDKCWQHYVMQVWLVGHGSGSGGRYLHTSTVGSLCSNSLARKLATALTTPDTTVWLFKQQSADSPVVAS